MSQLSSTQPSVSDERWQIEKDRMKKQQELLLQYDQEVYYPAKKALYERCLKENGSHSQGTWHENGLGWGWWYCSRCGVSHSKEKLYSLSGDLD